ncbi:heat shock protein DnaJ domain protein [Thalassoporum mexicanum PCC 7367]|uniref:J domain-containing protein n=1 Tax=Thalassoporum mexicanum TaxID=3457544 RepID=UPI00029FC641|nr:DnaJ domain-containing protein [Pseudanabaena sp. PCC 7367]AFY69057.1 heat shock protein DnaJ domain protein [Pseudanabaena sp. PCC 7367]
MPHVGQQSNHYSTLGIDFLACQSTIKSAYRSLAKQFHPDSNQELDNHDRIAAINNAYEVLSNPQSREFYDRSIGLATSRRRVQAGYAPKGRSAKSSVYVDQDQKLELWLKHAYKPIMNVVNNILDSLEEQMEELAADPYDDELMGDFEEYLEECRGSFAKAQILFRNTPNPATAAGAAEYLYHCLNQLGDGIEELNYFTLNYDYQHLHTGQELWRIAHEMREYAQESVQSLI